jgi:hypothetical protein
MTTIRNEHKIIEELFAKTNHSYNRFEKIYDEMKESTDFNSNQSLINQNIDSSLTKNKTNGLKNSRDLYESRRQSFQRINRLYHNNYTDLSVIEENPNEKTTQSTLISTLIETNNEMNKTPEKVEKSCCLETPQYEITPNYSQRKFCTPSIYNFDCSNTPINDISICTTQESLPYHSLKSPELTIHDLETTDDESNGISTSTPLLPIPKCGINLNERVSKRISSITIPYSPLTKRTSLKNIQNIFDCKPIARKSSIAKSDSKTNCISNSMASNSNDTNFMNTTKKRRKKCGSKSTNSETSDISDVSNRSTSYSRRNRLPVSYAEPKLNRYSIDI